ncbi:MAG: hypothetical protein R6V04_13490 [bacterium]
MERKNAIAQWAFDTRPILGRFHLWLEDVEVKGESEHDKISQSISFVNEGMERLFVMTAAVTALGTKLFGRYGEGKGVEKKELNQVKKDADAISAYAMSESLWYLSRSLPENHAIMVCLGEGLMPKAGETPEMGSNPLLGFGRIYARPQVAEFLEVRVQQLINDPTYGWEDFRREITNAGITIWGAAIDTLENTSRFAKGSPTGPITVLHLFDQPLTITKPYEGYMGNLVIPRKIVENAAKKSLLIDYFTPREKVLEAIKMTYPEIKNKNIHVWTLRGKSREARLGELWKEWESLGVHLVEDDWKLPTGHTVFTESGTYAPSFTVKTWEDDQGETHLFLVDGYAASAEAIQASSLSPILDLNVSLAIFSSKFKLDYKREAQAMHLDPDASNFSEKLSFLSQGKVDDTLIQNYKESINIARDAGVPLNKRTVTIDDFLPEKKWGVMAISGYMLPDPYSGISGIEKVSKDTYKVAVRLSTQHGDKLIMLSLRLLESFEENRLIFNPLLNRFMHGEDYKTRPVKISDSGRIRNELQTLCSEALEHYGFKGMKIYFNKISPDVISPENQKKLRQILIWYKENHPLWFSWLEFGD